MQVWSSMWLSIMLLGIKKSVELRMWPLQELCLRGKGLLAVSAGSLHEACLWNSLRVLRLARNMHVQVGEPCSLTVPAKLHAKVRYAIATLGLSHWFGPCQC